ncbi:MAG: hypothetical protein L0H38_01600 [bacterium]|nr:hypothetical protein [bacterium]
MSEKMTNTPENTELNRSTVPAEIIDFETKLAQQQDALAAAQASVEELSFKSSAEDHVYAKGELRSAKAAYDETMANMNDDWIKHGGERLEDARMAVDELDFGADASERTAAQTELRDAEDAWSESYRSDDAESVSPEAEIDQAAAAGIDKINQSADEHMAAIDDHAEQASAEIRDNAELAEAEAAPKKFDLNTELDQVRQKLSDQANELGAAAQERFIENNRIESKEADPTQADTVDEILAAKQALEHQERPDEAPAEEDTAEFADYEIPTSDEFVDPVAAEKTEAEAIEDTVEDSTETDAEAAAPEEAADGEFVDEESESASPESETETDDSEFVDDDETEDDQETGEKDKGRFGRMKSFLKNMRHKAGITTVKAYNTTMDGFGKLGKPLTSRYDGELNESYEDRSKVRGLAMVALAATAYAAYNRLSGGDSGEGFFGGTGGGETDTTPDTGINGSNSPESILGTDGIPDNIETDSADTADFDHDNTPDVQNWDSEALTADNGEGWYQTFEDMNIPRGEWDDLLQKTGPQLEAEGWAYQMDDGSYGISRPGAIPTEILDIIEANR